MRSLLLLLLVLPFCFSCSADLRPAKADTTYYNLGAAAEVDSSIIHFIQPFHDSLGKEMQQVIAVSDVTMNKAKPESLMGNFVADLLLEKGRAYHNGAGDFAVVNYGGLRIPSIPAGNITKGIIYELMPFDNFMVILELKGLDVKQLLDAIAAQGGWPVSGIKFTIHDGKAQDIYIGGKSLENNRIYQIIISDYLADGGESLLFLRSEKRTNTGLLIRDVILQYLREQTSQGLNVTAHLDNRITIHE